MKYLRILISVVLLINSGICRLNAQNKLYVKENSGTETVFVLSEIMKITFPGNSMTVLKNDASSETFNRADIRYLSFTDYLTGTGNPGLIPGDELRVLPNPVTSFFTVEADDWPVPGTNLEVLDIFGRVVRKYTNVLPNQRIDASGLPEGIYVCRLRHERAISTVKFIMK